MDFKIYVVKCIGCDDTQIPEFGNKFRIDLIKAQLRKIELECERMIGRNQKQFGDEWESIDKAYDLMQQLFDEIRLEDI